MNRIRSGKKKKTLRIAAVLTALTLCAGLWGQTGLVSLASNSLGSQTGQEGAEEAPEEEAPAENQEGGDVEAEIVDENTEDMAGTSTAARVRVIPSSARLRGEASTNSDQVGSLSSGDEIDVVGETTGSDGNLWYQVSGDVNGETVSGYIRSDLVEVTETAQAEAPSEAPAETPSETPSETESTPSDEYSVSYADDGTGTGVSDWYLNDNINGTRYKITDLLNAQQTNESNIAVMEEQTGSMRMIIIILAVIIALLVIVVTILIFKLRSSYEDDGYDEDDYGDEDDDRYDDEDDEEDEDEEEEYVPRRRHGAARRPLRTRQPSRRNRYDDEDEDDEEDEDDRYDDEEDEEPPRRSSRTSGRSQSGRAKSQKSYKPKNFVDMDEDDDLDFEFLDLK